MTVPADNIRHVENPEPLLTLWDQIMWAIATLAAAPAKFPRPERIVTDVQISAGECMVISGVLTERVSDNNSSSFQGYFID